MVEVFAPFASHAHLGVGAVMDEEVTPAHYDPVSQAMNRRLYRTTATPAELIAWYTEMERCLRNGIREVVALRTTASLARTPYFRGVISGLIYLMERGAMKLGAAMAYFPGAFDPVAVGLVKSGEVSGSQAATFKVLAARASSTSSLQKKFVGACVKPIMMVCIMVGALLLMHFLILPAMSKNFAAMRISTGGLPWPTRILVGPSDFLRAHPVLWAAPAVLTAAVLVGWRMIVNSRFYHWARFRLPLFGRAQRLLALSRSLAALSYLMGKGISLRESFYTAGVVSGHPEYSDFFAAVYSHIEAGSKENVAFLSERWRLGKEGRSFAGRLEAASISGETADSLKTIAALMAEDADAYLDALPKFIGPLANVLGALFALYLGLAIMLPNFKMLLEALKTGTSMAGS